MGIFSSRNEDPQIYFDKLTEISRFREIKRKTSISAKHMQIFEYPTTNPTPTDKLTWDS